MIKLLVNLFPSMVALIGMLSYLKKWRVVQCDQYQISKDVITLSAKPGQDIFHLPNIHSANDWPRLLITVKGDFTLSADCRHDGKSKFDAAGLCVCNEEFSYKFCVENYGNNTSKIASVLTQKYSDEVAGNLLHKQQAQLVLTRQDNILSSYIKVTQELQFHRSFYLKGEPDKLEVGFFAQAPMTNMDVKSNFSDMELIMRSTKHCRN